MKALTIIVAALVLAGMVGAAPAGLQAVFTVQFPKGHAASNAPCDPDAFCGVGEVTGFGQATITILDETFDEVDGSPCFAVTRVESIDLLDGTGSLVLQSEGTFCRPGRSGDSNAGRSSYGGPGRFDLTYTVDGAASTGVFAAATGTGSEVMKVDGGIGVWQLTGSLGGS
jgi:hypothetical protein